MSSVRKPRKQNIGKDGAIRDSPEVWADRVFRHGLFQADLAELARTAEHCRSNNDPRLLWLLTKQRSSLVLQHAAGAVIPRRAEQIGPALGAMVDDDPYSSMIDVLNELADTHQRIARQCSKSLKEIRPGRPKGVRNSTRIHSRPGPKVLDEAFQGGPLAFMVRFQIAMDLARGEGEAIKNVAARHPEFRPDRDNSDLVKRLRTRFFRAKK